MCGEVVTELHGRAVWGTLLERSCLSLWGTARGQGGHQEQVTHAGTHTLGNRNPELGVISRNVSPTLHTSLSTLC